MGAPDLGKWMAEEIGEAAGARRWTVSSTRPGEASVSAAEGGEAVVVDDAALAGAPGGPPRILVADEAGGEEPEGFFEVVPRRSGGGALLRALGNALELDRLRRLESDNVDTLRRRDYELRELIEIGKSLSSVKDVNLLLATILEKSRLLVGADAGSIYVIEGDAEEITERQLRFKLSQNDSISYESEEFSMPVSTGSIAGAAAVMRGSINIPDASRIPEDAPYHFDSTWDDRTGYRTRSVLAVPMINQEGDVLGVVQLINKKRDPKARLRSPDDFDREVVPMDLRSQELVETLASQAGVAMENALLYEEIQHIFDGFVRASVHAIEQRDPTTSGHSFRVAALTRRLAEVVSAQTEGPFAGATFTDSQLEEIETAALLHDFGKVGVREEVLVKAKKLYPPNLKIIRARLDYIKRSIENDHLQRRLMLIETGAPEEELAILDQASARAVGDIDECWRVISSANEPTVLSAGDFDRVEEISNRTYFDMHGKRQPFLEPEELKSLMIAKGSLTEEELEEIRSHASHTISFLSRIPWGRSLRNVPLFAGTHHEKLDGSGYPKGLTRGQIPLPGKIMAVADIYDALTASDRPYKKAVSTERALQILGFEVKDDHIDGELVRLFAENEVFSVLEEQSS